MKKRLYLVLTGLLDKRKGLSKEKPNKSPIAVREVPFGDLNNYSFTSEHKFGAETIQRTTPPRLQMSPRGSHVRSGTVHRPKDGTMPGYEWTVQETPVAYTELESKVPVFR